MNLNSRVFKSLRQGEGHTVRSPLITSAIACSNKEALVDYGRGKRFTFKQLNDRVNSVSHGLLKMGIGKGDVVGIITTNIAEGIEAFYACAKIGAISAPINYRLSAREIAQLYEHVDAKAIIYEERFRDEIIVKARARELKADNYICIADSGQMANFESLYEQLVAENETIEPDVPLDEHDYCQIRFTSGTTGMPKAFVVTNYQMSDAMSAFHHMLDLTYYDRSLMVIPYYGGVSLFEIMVSIYTRATAVVMNFEPEKVLEAIEKEKITFSNWVATMAQMALHVPNMENYDLSSLKNITFASAPLPGTIRDAVKAKITPHLREYYGSGEVPPLTAITEDMKELKPDSCGAVLPYREIRLVDIDGNDVPNGETGEIVTKCTGGTMEYWKEEEKTKKEFADGWFHTGDIGRFDEDNYLYIVGRKKEVVISGGQNIFVPEVDEVIMANTKVLDCASFPLPDEKWGERLAAAITVKAGDQLTEAEITKFCREHMAHFKVPKSIFFVDEIPRNPSGKVQRFILTKKFSA